MITSVNPRAFYPYTSTQNSADTAPVLRKSRRLPCPDPAPALKAIGADRNSAPTKEQEPNRDRNPRSRSLPSLPHAHQAPQGGNAPAMTPSRAWAPPGSPIRGAGITPSSPPTLPRSAHDSLRIRPRRHDRCATPSASACCTLWPATDAPVVPALSLTAARPQEV